MHHVAPTWRQPPRRSSPKTPGGPNPSQVMSAKFAGVSFFGTFLSNYSDCPCNLRLPGQRRFLWAMPQRGVAQHQAALRLPRAAARRVTLAAPTAPPRAAASAASACGPTARGTAFGHAVPLEAPPHLRRSGSRGGRRSVQVKRGRRRAGRPRPALRAAAVRTWRQNSHPSSSGFPVCQPQRLPELVESLRRQPLGQAVSNHVRRPDSLDLNGPPVHTLAHEMASDVNSRASVGDLEVAHECDSPLAVAVHEDRLATRSELAL